jgi:hypothetical protein
MKRPLTWRGIILLAAVTFVIGYPMVLFVQQKITRGIQRHGDLLLVDLKSMSDFEMDQDAGTDSEIPVVYRDLDGKRVQLVGQMWDPNSAEGSVRNFVLVYSITNCCFNGPPKVQHLVQATVLGDSPVDMHPDYVAVTGILHVGVHSSAGHVQSVYRIDVEQVKPE